MSTYDDYKLASDPEHGEAPREYDYLCDWCRDRNATVINDHRRSCDDCLRKAEAP